MKPFVITVARGYGSGGKNNRQMLAEDLASNITIWSCCGLHPTKVGSMSTFLQRADEKLKTPRLFKPRKSAYTGEVIPPDSEDFVSDQNLFNYQAKVIRDLARKNPV